jgi:hypothetical protein
VLNFVKVAKVAPPSAEQERNKAIKNRQSFDFKEFTRSVRIIN